MYVVYDFSESTVSGYAKSVEGKSDKWIAGKWYQPKSDRTGHKLNLLLGIRSGLQSLFLTNFLRLRFNDYPESIHCKGVTMEMRPPERRKI